MQTMQEEWSATFQGEVHLGRKSMLKWLYGAAFWLGLKKRFYLGRKVNRANWDPTPGLGLDEVPARLITDSGELKVKDNTLSFWESPVSGSDALERTALAVTADWDRLDAVSVAWVDRAAIEADGIALERTEGKTGVRGLKEAHVEAVRLDGFRLARIASRLAAAVRGNAQVRMLTREDVRGLLQAAVDTRRVEHPQLKSGLKAELRPPS